MAEAKYWGVVKFEFEDEIDPKHQVIGVLLENYETVVLSKRCFQIQDWDYIGPEAVLEDTLAKPYLKKLKRAIADAIQLVEIKRSSSPPQQLLERSLSSLDFPSKVTPGSSPIPEEARIVSDSDNLSEQPTFFLDEIDDCWKDDTWCLDDSYSHHDAEPHHDREKRQDAAIIIPDEDSATEYQPRRRQRTDEAFSDDPVRKKHKLYPKVFCTFSASSPATTVSPTSVNFYLRNSQEKITR